MSRDTCQRSPETPGPRVTLTFAEPAPPRFPRLSRGAAACRAGLRYALIALAAVWIFGGMLFFFLRFSAVFYRANEPAIQHVFDRLFH